MSNRSATVSEKLAVATATPSFFFLVSVTIILREYIKDLIFVILVQSKRYIASKLEWEIPAGRIEKNETPEEAAKWNVWKRRDAP